MSGYERAFFLKDDDDFDGLMIRSSANGTLALSPDGTTLAVCGNGGQVVLWNKENPDALRFIGRGGTSANTSTGASAMMMPKSVSAQATGSGPAASAVAFSADGKQMVVAAGPMLKLYDVATLKELTPLEGHERAVDFIAFSPDGKRCADF